MATYDHVNGNITLRVTDDGSQVRFWVLTDSQTYNHDQTWSFVANGITSGVRTFDMNNRGSWQEIGLFTTSITQTMKFTIYDTGLGFPTYTFVYTANRDTVPPKPAGLVISNVTSTTVDADGAGNGDGGSPVDFWQVGYGTSSTTPSLYKTTDMAGLATITGLSKGTTYYFWFRGHNALGYGPWSSRVTATTDDVPDPPSVVSLSSVTNTSVYAAFTAGSNNGASVDTYQIGYGTSSTTAQSTVTSDGSTTITGLKPGTTYYFWAKAHNAAGWGSYGARGSVTTKDVPDAPSAPNLSEITQTTARAIFTDNSNNGSTISAHQLGWATTSSAPTTTVSSDTDQVLTGLPAGKQLYFFARAQNSYGWGPWSVAKSAKTVAGAWVYYLPTKTWKPAIPWVRTNGVWKVAKPWVRIAGSWKGTTS